MRSEKPDHNTYTFDDYRREIREILDRNRGLIQICDVLKENGISRGNYYMFMKGGAPMGDNTRRNTLSFAKLDMLLSSLRSRDLSSSNRKRIEAMPDEELAQFIEEKLIGDPKAKQIDVLKWLRSRDKEIIYKEKSK